MGTTSELIAQQFSVAAGNKAAWESIIYNVKDPAYGAKGDGHTDDTGAIQKAVNEAAATGGEVRFPPGTYVLNGTVDLTALKLIVISGSGQSSTYLKVIGATNAGFRSGNCRMIMTNLAISGESSIEAVGQPVNGYGIDGTDNRSGKSQFQNVDFINLVHGIHADPGLNNASFYDSLFMNCVFFNCVVGIQTRELNNQFISTNFRLCDIGVQFLVKLEQYHFANCVFSGCNNDVRIEDHGASINFDTCWFENEGERSLGIGNGNVISSSLAIDSGTIKSLKFQSCYISDAAKFQTMTWINGAHRRRVIFDSCSFNAWPADMSYMQVYANFTFRENAHVNTMGGVANTTNGGVSAAFSTATTGLVSFNIPHGLSYIPTDESVKLSLVRATDPNVAATVVLYDSNTTNLAVRVYISVAGGAGSTAKVSWEASIGV